ncbi:MAG: antitoxin family protein [Desulfurococcales archaeon]|nr:antitoxin family protein [Desulfurococcales archaeon]
MSKVIRVRYEKGVLRPLDSIDAREGEIFYVKILKRELAEEVFGSLRVDKRVLEAIMREAEDEFGVY